MNIESSHKFNRSGDIASGCIEGVSLDRYQVGVVGAMRQAMSSGMHYMMASGVIVCDHHLCTGPGSSHRISISKLVLLI